MSVQTEIDRIITAVGAAYDAVEAKGGTLPTSETVANLAEAISSIPKDTHQAVEQATPSLTLNAATGVVTAEATQAAGLVAAGTKKATMQLTTQAAKTVTPSAAQQTAVASGKYTTGNVVVAAVPTEAKTVELSMPSGNQTVSPSSGKFLSEVTIKKPATMLPENIKKGVSIGGVVGTLESGGGGGGAVSPKDINFYDYDGTCVAAWSLAELAGKTALPDYPTHEGLTCQGWNWTLEAIKALNRPVTVGAMYITDDGATRLHIRIATVGRMTVPLYIGQTMSNGVSIDWGDGSAAKTLSGTGNVNTSHTYAEPGDYVISLMPKDGCTLSFGNGSSSYCVMGSTGNNSRVYCNMLQEFYVGKNVTSISNYAFNRCYSLASITIPNGVTSIGDDVFSYCHSLASITIPNGVTSIGAYAFNSCYSLASITIPNGVTSIGTYAFISCYSLASITILDGFTSIGKGAFNSCYSLASITIPNGVTSIGNYAFAYCYGIRYYDFSACTAIPALSDANAFASIPSDCQMLIPSALYNKWKAATNWATYASYMVSV